MSEEPPVEADGTLVTVRIVRTTPELQKEFESRYWVYVNGEVIAGVMTVPEALGAAAGSLLKMLPGGRLVMARRPEPPDSLIPDDGGPF